MFTDFLTEYNGKSNVGNTKENKGECVGLVCVYVDELHLPHIWGNACDLFENADEKFFDKILNTPDAIPQAGDIIIWTAKFNGTVGHTGIATGTADLNIFECFEQNDPLNSNCHLKSYNYNFVKGWLRPSISQNQPSNTIIQQSDAFIAVCTELGVTVATKDNVLAKIKGMEQQISTLEDNSQQLDRTNKDLMAQILEVKGELSTAQASNKTLQDNYSASQLSLKNDESKITDLTNTVSELEAQIKTPTYTGFKKWIFDTFLK